MIEHFWSSKTYQDAVMLCSIKCVKVAFMNQTARSIAKEDSFMQVLKTIIFIAAVLALGVGMSSAENLVKTQSWSYVADTVMGGVSKGSASYVEKGASIRLSGTVSTKNNGGFIQVRTNMNPSVSLGKNGIRIEVKGNNETYNVHLRNGSSRLPWQYYAVEFMAPNNWVTIELPFSNFKKSSTFMKTKMDPASLKSLGVVAYGKDYKADVLIRKIELY